MKVKIFVFSFLCLLLVFGAIFIKPKNEITVNQISQNDNNFITSDATNLNTIAETGNQEIPSSYTIKNVPFTSQAPDANWDELHDEACEEASLIIVNYFFSDKKLTKDLAESEIQNLVTFEKSYFGSHKDLTAAEVVDLAQQYYKMNNLKVIEISSTDEIKKEISQNHLVIAPTAGRELHNPNFRSPGPVYHMLVISGYTEKNFITQDVGTRKGQNYIYDEDVLFEAIHDWHGPGDILNGLKNIIVAS